MNLPFDIFETLVERQAAEKWYVEILRAAIKHGADDVEHCDLAKQQYFIDAI